MSPCDDWRLIFASVSRFAAPDWMFPGHLLDLRDKHCIFVCIKKIVSVWRQALWDHLSACFEYVWFFMLTPLPPNACVCGRVCVCVRFMFLSNTAQRPLQAWTTPRSMLSYPFLTPHSFLHPEDGEKCRCGGVEITCCRRVVIGFFSKGQIFCRKRNMLYVQPMVLWKSIYTFEISPNFTFLGHT